MYVLSFFAWTPDGAYTIFATLNRCHTVARPPGMDPSTATVYQPMLELLAFLCANGFKTIVVSSGGVEVMRTYAEDVYGIKMIQ